MIISNAYLAVVGLIIQIVKIVRSTYPVNENVSTIASSS